MSYRLLLKMHLGRVQASCRTPRSCGCTQVGKLPIWPPIPHAASERSSVSPTTTPNGGVTLACSFDGNLCTEGFKKSLILTIVRHVVTRLWPFSAGKKQTTGSTGLLGPRSRRTSLSWDTPRLWPSSDLAQPMQYSRRISIGIALVAR